MKSDLLYQLALAHVPHIGPIHAKTLVEHFGSATAIFKATRTQLEAIEGIGPARAVAILSYHDYDAAEKEIQFMEKYRIRPLFLTDPDYPQRLLHCYDAPVLLFYKGQADLNKTRILSVIGTRSHTPYGKHLTETLIADLANYDVLILSGLAFGIDVLAHKSAMKHALPTVGVLAHGLDTLYPAQHKAIAKEIVASAGGLLTEFPSQTAPDKHNFPARNRIVAGMSDAVVVIETGVKGGSMITAELGNSYHKEVFAFPGKTTDTKSAGCNQLIRHNKAMLLTDTQQLIDCMGWEPGNKKTTVAASGWTPTATEQQLMHCFATSDTVHIDELNTHSKLGGSTLAATILNLELQGIVQSLPGKRYKLLLQASPAGE
ncbi:DNA-processing protein DprA [Paraflavitalea pollutisoli]|uniref:DNA-processing protein DprA n=1 Tax=Paraflavitalea pollutisoli TaxID=3034143 RepID=UPI0023EAF6CF|nr:DNA-processing protein DprA [Paraflavitalea sp. H1-2-19X]